jgi:hypothetical protein
MICLFCDEEVRPQDKTRTVNESDLVHLECMMRQVVGSVGHQNGTCSCFGGSDEDPPGMTKREAAQEALALWLSRHPWYRSQLR